MATRNGLPLSAGWATMRAMSTSRLWSLWPLLVPLAAAGLLATSAPGGPGALLLTAWALALLGAVVASVHHAETIAHRLGEPYGTLVLALAVTVIEVALILSVMLSRTEAAATITRDTIFATVMIVCNGVVGLCLLLGGLRHREQTFRIEGTGSGMAALTALCGLVLVMPGFTTSAPGVRYSDSQMVFVALSSLTLWLVFVFIQTVRHRDYFLPSSAAADESVHAPPPSRTVAASSFVLLVVSLVAVVVLAKRLSPAVAAAVSAAGAPQAVVGIVIAMIVLLPETAAALRAARADRLQTSMNLAIGSAMASIGLTIPAVALAVVVLGLPLELGVDGKGMVLLGLTFLVGAITLGSGRTNMMQGAVHLVLFGAFLFLTLVP